MDLKEYILEIQNFPKEGISFKDITPILQNPDVLSFVVEELSKNLKNIDKIVGLDARGFIFGSLVAYKIKKPFVMIRKKGKLPGECENIKYDLEYGSNVLEVQKESIKPGDKVAIVDDLLATGGTAKAASDLVEKLGGLVDSLNFVIELEFLNGKRKFDGKKIYSLIKY